MSSREFMPRRNDSYPDRLFEVAQVAIGTLIFCSVTIVGLAAAAWVILVVADARHSGVNAVVLVAQYVRVPFGVAAGLSIFFAAVSWDSVRMRPSQLDESIDRRLAAIEQRLGIERVREIS